MTFRVLSLPFVLVLPGPALAAGEIGTDSPPPTPPGSCAYYEEYGFRGAFEVIPGGELRRYLGDAWNDRISSIACAPGCELRVWEFREATGGERRFGRGTYYVGDDWNDIISAAEAVCEAPPRTEAGLPQPLPGGSGLSPPPPPAPGLPTSGPEVLQQSPRQSPSEAMTPEASGGDCTYGPFTCKPGYVWRAAGPDDVVCVTPEVRERSWEENDLAESRRVGIGPSGVDPDTCLSGFVWRDAFPGDTVCVPPESRDQAWADNQEAPSRDACPL